MGLVKQTQQQVQNQLVNKDSLSTSSTLRTPIQQIEVKEPRHLQVQKQGRVSKPKYKHWTHEDSVYFNLTASDVPDFFSSDIKSIEPSPFNQTVSKEPLKLPKTNTEDSITIESPAVVITETPAPPVTIRKGSPFKESKDWLAGFILLAIIIAGFVKLTASKYLSDLFSSIRYQQSASKMFSTFNLQTQKPGWALTILFFLSTSLLVFEYAHLGGKTPEKLNTFTFFLVVHVGVILYFFLKNLLYRFVAYVFDCGDKTKEYTFNANMLSKAFGIACLPIVSIVPFVDILTATFLLKSGLVLFLIMYLIQLLRGAKIILHSPLSILYMFLYFCALEILPLSILIKVMIY